MSFCILVTFPLGLCEFNIIFVWWPVYITTPSIGSKLLRQEPLSNKFYSFRGRVPLMDPLNWYKYGFGPGTSIKSIFSLIGTFDFRVVSPSSYEVSTKHSLCNSSMSAGIYWFGSMVMKSPTLSDSATLSPIIVLFSFLSALCLYMSSIKSFKAVATTITTRGVYSVGNPSDTVMAGI
jgi:hypothetical protein